MSQVRNITGEHFTGANLNAQRCKCKGLQHRHVNVIIILLNETLIKLPLILSPVACRRILLATSGIGFPLLSEIYTVVLLFKVKTNEIHAKYLVWCDVMT